MGNTVNYDKRVYLNSRNENRAGYDRIGGKLVFRSGYGVAAYVCCYCTKCGAEYLGYVERLYLDEFPYMQHLHGDRETETDPKLGYHCPICGNSFAHNDRNIELDSCGDLVSRLKYDTFHGFSSRVDYFAEKANYRKNRLLGKTEDRFREIELNANFSTPIQNSNNSIIKADPEKLKEYISHLIRLEGNIYALKQRLTELYFQQSENEKYIIFCEHKPAYDAKKALDSPKGSAWFCVEENGILQDRERRKAKVDSEIITYPNEPHKPELFHVGILDFMLGNAAKNEKLLSDYEKDMEKYRSEVAKCDAKKARNAALSAQYASEIEKVRSNIAKKRAELTRQREIEIEASIRAAKQASPALAIKDMLDNEVRQAEEALRNLLSARTQLYGFEIVFGKYRDIVPLTTFYEYLMAGRCTSLEGANGAYNLYESEIRANLIISKLDDIITRLDKIIDNQYTITSMMNNINSQLGQLNDTMSKAEKSLSQISQNTARIAENSEVIAHNTAVSAYYSKVNAELTNSMGYLMAYKL